MVGVTLFEIIFTVLFVVVGYVQGEFRGSAGRIVGGERAPDGAYPFMVSMQLKLESGKWQHHCGGSILHPEWVLTACHCVAFSDQKPLEFYYLNEFLIIAGVNNLNNKNKDRQEAQPKEYFAHPKCNTRGIPQHTYHDVGLIKLKSAFQITPRVQPLKLFSRKRDVAFAEQRRLQEAHTLCFTPGWGVVKKDPQRFSPNLKYANVTLQTTAECHELACNIDPPTEEGGCANFDKIEQLCGTSATATICAGDSGSPLVCNGYVFGVVSLSNNCRIGDSTMVYAGITAILKTVKKHGPKDQH